MHKTLLYFIIPVLTLIFVILVRAVAHSPKVITVAESTAADRIPTLSYTAANNLSQAIQFKTISYAENSTPNKDFEKFLIWIKKTYPGVFSRVEHQRIGEYSLLLKWQGSNPKLKPILFSAHYDVVPAPKHTEKLWQHPPFSGHIDGEFIWGRGALDDKSSLIAIMEAVNKSLSYETPPQRTLYIALTHDEELGSPKGATAIANLLLKQGVKIAWSLDEGSFVIDGLAGIKPAVASINVAEKGYATVELVATELGGHSAMPPAKTSVGILAEAIVKLQNNPIPGGFDKVSTETYDILSRYMSFDKRIFFSNQWLFSSSIASELSKDPYNNAILRTTMAPTMLTAGIKDNILPITAVATINFRLHPRNTHQQIIEYINKTVADDRIEVILKTHHKASKVSDYTVAGFLSITSSVRKFYPDAIVTPGITVAGTDSKQYQRVAENSYRFSPMKLKRQDISRFHGSNERVSIENMGRAVSFYYDLINRSVRLATPPASQ